MRKIEAGARSDNVAGYLNGGSSVVFPVYLTSDANALETVNNIKAVLADAETFSGRYGADYCSG